MLREMQLKFRTSFTRRKLTLTGISGAVMERNAQQKFNKLSVC